MKRVIFLLFLCFVVWSCEKDPEPSYEIPSVSTGKATSITSTTANIDINIDGDYFLYGYGILFGRTPDLSISDSKVYERKFEVQLKSLIPNTTYYFKAFVRDKLGNYIFGNVVAFKTAEVVNVPAAVKTLYGYYKDYSLAVVGLYPPYKFWYTNYFNVNVSLVGKDKVSKWGVDYGKKANFSDANSLTMTGLNSYIEGSVATAELESRTDSDNSYYIFCRAWAKLLNGTYIYGETITVQIQSH